MERCFARRVVDDVGEERLENVVLIANDCVGVERVPQVDLEAETYSREIDLVSRKLETGC